MSVETPAAAEAAATAAAAGVGAEAAMASARQVAGERRAASNAEGAASNAEGAANHAEGAASNAEGAASHAEGAASNAEGGASLAEELELADVMGRYPRPELSTAYRAPLDALEQALHADLAELLGIEQLGRDDDFYELGFDSLVGHRLVERARRRGLAVSLRDVLDAPSIAGLAQRVRAAAARQQPAAAHPLLGVAAELDAARGTWRTMLSPARDWVLGEHQIGGRAVLVGSAYLEAARAAFERFAAADLDVARRDGRELAVVLRDVELLQPLAVDRGGSTVLQTRLRRAGEAIEVEIGSAPRGGSIAAGLPGDASRRGEVLHAVGSVCTEPAGPAPRLDLAALRAGSTSEMGELNAAAHPPGVVFGQRWRALRRVWQSPAGVLTEVALDGDLAARDAAFALHPALLDAAVARVPDEPDEPAGALRDGEPPAWLPFAYDRVVVRGPMPAHCFGWTRERRQERSLRQMVLDVQILTADGVEVLRVDGLRLRRLESPSPQAAPSRRAGRG